MVTAVPIPAAKYFEKEAIRPGALFFEYDGENGERRADVFQVNTHRVRHWHNVMKAMLSRGVQISIPLEHGGELPVTNRDAAARLAKHNAGWVHDCRIGPKNELLVTMKITDPEVAKGIENGSISYVSPMFEPEILEGHSGIVHQDAIAHIALTPKPVQAIQGDFRRVALSRASATTIKPVPSRVKGMSVGRVAFSRNGGGYMATENEKPDDDSGVMIDDGSDGGDEKKAPPVEKADDGGSGGDAGNIFDEGAMPEVGDDTGSMAAPQNMLGGINPEVIAALAEIGIFIPDNATMNGFQDLLLTAIRTKLLTETLASGGAPAGNGLTMPPDPGADAGDVVPPPGAPGSDPNTGENGLAVTPPGDQDEEIKEQQLRVPLSRYADGKLPVAWSAKPRIAAHKFRVSLGRRADALLETARISPKQHSKLLADIRKARVKIRLDSGSVEDVSGMTGEITKLESLQQGAAFSRGAGKPVEHDNPEFFNKPASEMTPERAKEVADMMCEAYKPHVIA